MADGLTQIGVLFMAVFVVPQLMSLLPDFDPLLLIIVVFAILALAQQAGFATQGGDGPAGRPEGRARSNGAAPEAAQEATVEQLLGDATKAIAQNRYDRAEELAKRATDLDPELAEAWELLATAQRWAGRRAEAAATVQKATDIYEVSSSGLTKLAAELAAPEEEHDAAQVEELEAKADDFFAKSQYDLAMDCYSQALDAQRKASETEAAADQASRLRLLRRRGACAQQLQDWKVCRRDATEVLESDPQDLKALLQRAAANEALEKFSDALVDARKLLAAEPRNAAANRLVHNCQQALRAQ